MKWVVCRRYFNGIVGEYTSQEMFAFRFWVEALVYSWLHSWSDGDGVYRCSIKRVSK